MTTTLSIRIHDLHEHRSLVAEGSQGKCYDHTKA